MVAVAGATGGDPPPGIDGVPAGVELVFAESPEGLREAIGPAEAVFAWLARADLLRPAWENAHGVRWVQSSTAGVDSLLFPELVASDVVLTNAGGVFETAMAESAIGFLLAFAKDLPGTIAAQRDRRWAYRHSDRLAGRRLLVVGAGPIGREVGRLGRALGMRVRGVARRARDGDDVFEAVAPVEHLHHELANADDVVNALPLTPETRGLFDAEALSSMVPGVRFVNLGRGGTVDEPSLARALQDGHVAAAALDAFETEPLPSDSPLWELGNAIVSPHMSGDAHGWEAEVVGVFLDNLGRWLDGEPLRNVVDKRAGYVPTA